MINQSKRMIHQGSGKTMAIMHAMMTEANEIVKSFFFFPFLLLLFIFLFFFIYLFFFFCAKHLFLCGFTYSKLKLFVYEAKYPMERLSARLSEHLYTHF